MDEHVGVAGELERGGVVGTEAVLAGAERRRAVIGHIGERRVAVADAIAERRAALVRDSSAAPLKPSAFSRSRSDRSPRSSRRAARSAVGKCGGDMTWPGRSALAPSSCSGSSRLTRDPSRSPPVKNGSPCTWSQCRWVSRIVPSKGWPPSSGVTAAGRCPRRGISVGPASPSWAIARQEVWPP